MFNNKKETNDRFMYNDKVQQGSSKAQPQQPPKEEKSYLEK